MKPYTTDKIGCVPNGVLEGNPTIIITGIEQISQAATGQLTFIGEKKYIEQWNQSEASAAIVSEKLNVEPGQGPGTDPCGKCRSRFGGGPKII